MGLESEQVRDDLFMQLGNKFASLSELASPNEACSLERTMAEAGRFLFHALAKGWIALEAAPPWLKEQPVQPILARGRQGEVEEVLEPQWAMYWWYAIVWLQRERPDTGIVLPASRLQRLEARPLWCDFGSGPFTDALTRRPSKESEVGLWREIASCSADACKFLALEVAGDYMPAVYFAQFGIKGDGLRKAKEQRRVRAESTADGHNLYNVKDVQKLRPECFRKPEQDQL